MTTLEINILCDHPDCDLLIMTDVVEPGEELEAVECEVKSHGWSSVPHPAGNFVVANQGVRTQHFCPLHAPGLPALRSPLSSVGPAKEDGEGGSVPIFRGR